MAAVILLHMNWEITIGKSPVRIGDMYLTPLSTIIELYRGGQCSWCRELEYSKKTTDLSQGTANLCFTTEDEI
jgi:hypothetical protein